MLFTGKGGLGAIVSSAWLFLFKELFTLLRVGIEEALDVDIELVCLTAWLVVASSSCHPWT